jgi:hypothetical protein
LPQDALTDSVRDIIIGFAGYCHPPRLGRVFELAMASSLRHLHPAIILYNPDNLPELHSDWENTASIENSP